MLDFNAIAIKKLSVHRVGNKSRNEGVQLSSRPYQLNSSEIIKSMLTYFLRPFEKNDEYYDFYHTTDIELNELRSYSENIFKDKKSFHQNSEKIAKLLYNYSTHPKIESGELYVCLFTGIFDGDNQIDAIGIYKSEGRDKYIKTFMDNDKVEITLDDGMNISKSEKACLIFCDTTSAYKILIIDTTNKNSEAQYWKDEFIKCTPLQDSYHITGNYLKMTKEYVATQIQDEFEVTSTDKMEYLNKTVDYFKSNKEFDENKFLTNVFHDKNVIESFKTYKDEYLFTNNIDIDSRFEISDTAVKKQAKIFKNVLKLDKNFHVYVHGNTNLIEKGYDPKIGKHYYKIYFDEES